MKLNDPDIEDNKKMSYENYLARLYDGTFKGFNLVFGNIFDQEDGRAGRLRYYQNKNLDYD